MKLKDNWLLILLPLVLIFVVAIGFSGISWLMGSLGSSSYEDSSGYGGLGIYESASSAPVPAPSRANSFMKESSISTPSEVSAPEVNDRMIAKTARMETKVKRGTFLEEEATLKSIVKSSDAIMLWQNVETYGKGSAKYTAGRYQIKIDSNKYDAIISQLKSIGAIESFTENAEDVTQTYTDINIQLENEKKRLKRYEEMYKEATLLEDKIGISDRIFNQENYIKYLEDTLKNVGDKVVYSTIDITITELKSGYAELAFVSLSGLVKAFVDSVSGFIYIFIVLLPWTLGLWFIIFVIRKIRRRGKKK
ncbi:DUF4349 domain-containing protein [Candidatus Woesearchaeota archaeon]|nr:DUF4349 domain-containing protein [Candidatus Woesearchaeota archaeon]